MAIPDYQSLMLPVLKEVNEGEHRLSGIVQSLSTKLGLTDSELAELLPSGKQTIFVNRVGWAKTYLSKAGLLKSSRRGYFEITNEGRKVIESNPQKITNEFLMQSFSGLVVQSFFASRSAAAAFAGRCAGLVGFAVVVRPAWSDAVAGGFCWAVSVPVVR
jgi:restriction endonuclease Mrr